MEKGLPPLCLSELLVQHLSDFCAVLFHLGFGGLLGQIVMRHSGRWGHQVWARAHLSPFLVLCRSLNLLLLPVLRLSTRSLKWERALYEVFKLLQLVLYLLQKIFYL